MIHLLTTVKTRLQPLAALTGWTLFTAAELGPRQAVPRAAIGFSSAGVATVKTTAAQVEPSLAITLVVKHGDGADVALDSAMSAVIEQLHNWVPGEHGGRGWETMQLAQITAPPDFESEEGLVGLTIAFTTQTLYRGQP
ncbi:MAG TPA: hypothetical protein DCY64_02470 [Hydrogenophaga sp.]|uniref:hypothetical protein n=1 Tax=Hydrogenophaga sp. TaxID=1904254 RepID=UPI0008ACEDAD|nr:hypothetical protein [Hydrogenophaga sp.]OGA78897.1 MAG: hypothetical protein A2X73_08165 [Burkholderiales bacterium GWE1_65_30]OGA91194.1 MAG: hypothetical protein A2X72_07590 [Burkholderiales bacterium GWF1_66_17]HAX19132.1 hypothetical protein [Hydrogenophaga sp.]HBU20637.1 hypothetical protein [Hydrogenophaga sp.]